MRIGSPITGYGQESRNRAARQRIPNRIFTDEDGVEHVQVNCEALPYEICLVHPRNAKGSRIVNNIPEFSPEPPSTLRINKEKKSARQNEI